MQQSTIFVEIILNRCYGRSVKSKKPKQKTCPLCRNRYCLAMIETEPVERPGLPSAADLDAVAEEQLLRGIPFDADVPAHVYPTYGGIERTPNPGIPFNPPDRIAMARQRAEALLQKVTQ